MRKVYKYLIIGVLASLFIYGLGYASDVYEEIQEAVQKQYFPYKVIKPMDIWTHSENATLYGYFLEREDYEAIKKLKLRKSNHLQVAKPGQVIELVDASNMGTGDAILNIRVKGSLDFTYVHMDYFSSCTEYIGIGSKE